MIRYVCVLLAGCAYISQPYEDPADPLVIELVNRGSDPLYLTAPLLDGAVRFATKNGDAVRASASCAEAPCSGAACGFVACAASSSVRELSPGEGVLVEWTGVRYERSEMACSGAPVQCVAGERASERTRYVVTACFARAFKQAGAVLSRSQSDAQVIDGAVLDGEECAAPVEVGFPSFDVRYQIELR